MRFTNTPYLPKYLSGETIDATSITPLSVSDDLIESFFLALRTDRGISNVQTFESVLVADYQKKLQFYEKSELVDLKGSAFSLTDRGMDCYNAIVTELLREV